MSSAAGAEDEEGESLETGFGRELQYGTSIVPAILAEDLRSADYWLCEEQ